MHLHTLFGIFAVGFGLTTYLQPCDCICHSELAARGQIPYQAKIIATLHHQNPDFRREYLCGGSIIDVRWIITSAQCLYDQKLMKLRVTVGEHRLNIYGDEHIIKRIIIHKGYDGAWKNNVALLELSQSLGMTHYVKKVPLGWDYVEADVAAVVSGWGGDSLV